MIMKLSVCWPCVWAGTGLRVESWVWKWVTRSLSVCTLLHDAHSTVVSRAASIVFVSTTSTINCIGLKHRLFIIRFKPSVSKGLCNVLGYDSAYQNDVSFGFCRLRFCQKSNVDVSGNALFPSSFPASSFCTKTLLSQKNVQRTTFVFSPCCMISKGTPKKFVNFL